MNFQNPRLIPLAKVWDAMVEGARQYVRREGFTCINGMPELVGVSGSCESVNSLYTVDHFGQKAYLAQSDQLYLEQFTPGLKKVYCEIQSFRAEAEVDSRHLCQFPLFEIEHEGYFLELKEHISGVVSSAVQNVVVTCEEELSELGVSKKHWDRLVALKDSRDFHHMTYSQALDYLKRNGFPELNWGDDLKAAHEVALAEDFGEMFLERYPLAIKFPTMREAPADADPNGPVVYSCDLILPKAGESAGAAERETDYEKLSKRIYESDMYRILIEQGAKKEDFDWYLDIHKDNNVKTHSGAGIGLARVAQYIVEADDIRDAVLFVVNRETLL